MTPLAVYQPFFWTPSGFFFYFANITYARIMTSFCQVMSFKVLEENPTPLCPCLDARRQQKVGPADGAANVEVAVEPTADPYAEKAKATEQQAWAGGEMEADHDSKRGYMMASNAQP